MATQNPRSTVDALYRDLLVRGVAYFLPGCRIEPSGTASEAGPALAYRRREEAALDLEWLGTRYKLASRGGAISDTQVRLVRSIGRVLTARYELLVRADLEANSFHLFRGLSEDRYVSAFLDPAPYASSEDLFRIPDRVSEAIEVLRVTASTTYENRRIATGALLFGSHPDPCHELPPLPEDALPYSSALTAIRSFHRLSDGLNTVALVDGGGLLVELVDVEAWARPYAGLPLPVPSAGRFAAHSRATLCGGHVCLVLTLHGEIKIFAGGTQAFNYLDGRWRLTDAAEKYQRWAEAVEDPRLAELLFVTGLNLAEERRGGLFVVLDDAATAPHLVAPGDLLAGEHSAASVGESKGLLHYLLRGKRALDLAPTVLETVARIDGGIVLDRQSNLLAFGAILRAQPLTDLVSPSIEGGRTTAAIGASRFGPVLKISEDGLVSYYRNGHRVWEL
jgi:hypothetical protein